jgi:hypothetical protein
MPKPPTQKVTLPPMEREEVERGLAAVEAGLSEDTIETPAPFALKTFRDLLRAALEGEGADQESSGAGSWEHVRVAQALLDMAAPAIRRERSTRLDGSLMCVLDALDELKKATQPSDLEPVGEDGAGKERWNGVANIAWCPEHGLHGARDTCFECGRPVEQIPMLEVGAIAKARGAAQAIVKGPSQPPETAERGEALIDQARELGQEILDALGPPPASTQPEPPKGDEGEPNSGQDWVQTSLATVLVHFESEASAADELAGQQHPMSALRTRYSVERDTYRYVLKQLRAARTAPADPDMANISDDSEPKEKPSIPAQGEPPTLSSEQATALVAVYFGEDHDVRSADAAIKHLGDWLDRVYEVKRPFEEGFAPDTPMPECRRRPTRRRTLNASDWTDLPEGEGQG